ncbi:phospholipase D/transphosphatidylase [Ruminococcus albus 7 = DSM 20455]|uniref:Phospholipase D/transphosphatidylase n=1 Tax=Ruminococcus albus (strain ATCC 27210 / DSM 20455 / JCM 14654 / NCDO 2250 / 7) TaxID=697329 RepID=E6UI81_RUMA7|nr:phospholipase D/transphosphatidylase [Ruminococcus albus 7 = DSM 20455]
MIKNKRILKFLASLVVCAYIFTNSGIILGEAFFENLDNYDDYDLLTLMIEFLQYRKYST